MLIALFLAKRSRIPLMRNLSADNRRRIGYLLELSSMRLATDDRKVQMQKHAKDLRDELIKEIGKPENWPKIFLNQAELSLRMRGENDDLAKRWKMADSLSTDRMKSELAIKI